MRNKVGEKKVGETDQLAVIHYKRRICDMRKKVGEKEIENRVLCLEVGWIRRIHVLDTAYWGFLGVGTTHGYVVSSLMDTAYWSSEHTRLPSIFDEGTRKSQPLLEGTNTNPKDSRGNIQPADKGLPSTISDEGAVKTTPLPEGPLGDKDSKGNKTPGDMEPINPIVTEPLELTTFSNVQACLPSEDEMSQEIDDEELFAAGEDMDVDTHADEEEH
ncbi:hypothetical protein Tco_0213237 [Tanacetum coccineum]